MVILIWCCLLFYASFFEVHFDWGTHWGFVASWVLKNQRKPFDIKNEQNAMLLARYLVEDNNERFVEFNEKATISVDIFKSVLRTIVGNYKLLSEEAIIDIRERLHQVCSMNCLLILGMVLGK